jgi:hypothetical protein
MTLIGESVSEEICGSRNADATRPAGTAASPISDVSNRCVMDCGLWSVVSDP